MAFNFLTTLEWQGDFWSDIVLPEGLMAKKETLVDAIVDRCATLRPYYSNPRLFKRMSDHFFESRQNELKRLWDLSQMDYNPIENYDRYEDSENIAHNETTLGSTSESQISAMNSGSYQPDNKVIAGGGDQADGNNRFNSHIHGNIGVTTTQQMIEAERRLLDYSVFEHIAQMYEKEFFIRVY